MLATLFFNVAHYALRPWPWIITGLCTVLLYPGGVEIAGKKDVEAAYVQAMVDLLPSGWRGFMLAGFAAAYMSTIGTQLNWGASYLVNDVYRRFLKKDATEQHYVLVSRLTTVLLFLASIVVTSISGRSRGVEVPARPRGGTGLVLILRWYWWRINAWCEISAMGASMVVSLVAMWWFKRPGAVAPGPEPSSRSRRRRCSSPSSSRRSSGSPSRSSRSRSPTRSSARSTSGCAPAARAGPGSRRRWASGARASPAARSPSRTGASPSSSSTRPSSESARSSSVPLRGFGLLALAGVCFGLVMRNLRS